MSATSSESPDVGRGRCWICRRALVTYSDGDGAVYEGCPPCRQEIEALQARLERLAPDLRPRCVVCRAHRVSRMGQTCQPCRAEAARIAERRRRREAMEQAQAAGALAEQEARRQQAVAAEAARRERTEPICATCQRRWHRGVKRGAPPRECPRCRGQRARMFLSAAACHRLAEAAAAKGAATRRTVAGVLAADPGARIRLVAEAAGVSEARVYQILQELGVKRERRRAEEGGPNG